MRGGVSYNSLRFSKTNNKYEASYDPKKDKLYDRANKLYD